MCDAFGRLASAEPYPLMASMFGVAVSEVSEQFSDEASLAKRFKRISQSSPASKPYQTFILSK